jgi:hypothetical protein
VNPTKVRVVVSMADSFGDRPFDTRDDGNPGTFWVDWELCCNDVVDPIGTAVCKTGDWEVSGVTRTTKKWSKVKGTPLSDFDHCRLKVWALMGGTGELAIKTQAKY